MKMAARHQARAQQIFASTWRDRDAGQSHRDMVRTGWPDSKSETSPLPKKTAGARRSSMIAWPLRGSSSPFSIARPSPMVPIPTADRAKEPAHLVKETYFAKNVKGRDVRRPLPPGSGLARASATPCRDLAIAHRHEATAAFDARRPASSSG